MYDKISIETGILDLDKLDELVLFEEINTVEKEIKESYKNIDTCIEQPIDSINISMNMLNIYNTTIRLDRLKQKLAITQLKNKINQLTQELNKLEDIYKR